MESFELFWDLFDPDPEFNNRRRACGALWEQKSEQQRQAILEFLRSGQPRNTRNPYYFLADFRVRRAQKMSFNEYYKQYGTTEEREGWKMVKPQKAGDPPVYYVKSERS